MKIRDCAIPLRCRACGNWFDSHPNGITRDSCPACSSDYVQRVPRYALTMKDAHALLVQIADAGTLDDATRARVLTLAARCDLEVRYPEEGM